VLTPRVSNPFCDFDFFFKISCCVLCRSPPRSRHGTPGSGPHPGPPSLLLVAYNIRESELGPESVSEADLHKTVDSIERRHGEEDSDRNRDRDEGGKDGGGNEEAHTDSTHTALSPDVKSVEMRSTESAPSCSKIGGSILVFKSIRSLEPEREKDTVRLFK
jgi:hypothetical protein